MRPIKFRAHQEGEIGRKSFKYFTIQEMQSQLGFEYGFPENIPVEGFKWVYDQFTGLLDKNSKEIYEGDILWGNSWEQSSPQAKEHRKVAEVIFHEGAFKLRGSETWNLSTYINVEVIGNIYESPELVG